MIDFSLVLSLLSLGVSCYALYRRGPVGPQGETGPQGEKGETTVVTVQAPVVEVKPIEESRKEILEKAKNTEFITNVSEITKRLRQGSGLIGVDADAQKNLSAFRIRNK